MLAHAISRAMGAFANWHFSYSLQKLINYLYVKTLGLDLTEFAPSSSYTSLQALFTRKLIAKRQISSAKIVCPTDSFVMAQGEIINDLALQIKGKNYDVAELLDEKSHGMQNGTFINFYLSPKDYHRYHAPCDIKILMAKHIPGELFPVNRPALNFVCSLFARNERVVLECLDADKKRFWFVCVGALNVGKMKFNFDERIQTNAKKDKISIYEYQNLEFVKGDELGYFELGSTVVALFPKDNIKLRDLTNKKVKFGEGLSVD